MAGPHTSNPNRDGQDRQSSSGTESPADHVLNDANHDPAIISSAMMPAHLPMDLFEDSLAECKQKLVAIQEIYRRLKDLCDSLEQGRMQLKTAGRSGDSHAPWRLEIKRSSREVYSFDTNKLSFDRGLRNKIQRAWKGEERPAARRRKIRADDNGLVSSSPESEDEHASDVEAEQSNFSHSINGANGGPRMSANGYDCMGHKGHVNFRAQQTKWPWPLESEEYKRYGRQLIMPEVGLQGQLRLKRARVLIVGAGGLGCPAAAYLAGAGIGKLGIVDRDTVELSNLHRQILHTSDAVGMLKVQSAIKRLKDMNPLVKYTAHKENLTSDNARRILSKYDIVLDCTDRPTSRYLISDTCVMLGRPLVSASALRTDGQLMILNFPPAPAGDESGGPCYRCVWPKPPPAENVVSCGEGGILGPVVGVMGVLMALEAVKLITSGGIEGSSSRMDDVADALSDGPPSTRSPTQTEDTSKPSPHRPTMLLFSATSPRPFQTVRLQSRRKDCPACSSHATNAVDSLTSGSTDYVAFCGLRSPVRVLQPEQRLTPKDYAIKLGGELSANGLVDVRDQVQFDLCHMPGSVNVPWSIMEQWAEPTDVDEAVKAVLSHPKSGLTFVCREGNDSQLAVRKMQQLGMGKEGEGSTGAELKDISGGWEAWRRDVDPEWPQY